MEYRISDKAIEIYADVYLLDLNQVIIINRQRFKLRMLLEMCRYDSLVVATHHYGLPYNLVASSFAEWLVSGFLTTQMRLIRAERFIRSFSPDTNMEKIRRLFYEKECNRPCALDKRMKRLYKSVSK